MLEKVKRFFGKPSSSGYTPLLCEPSTSEKASLLCEPSTSGYNPINQRLRIDEPSISSTTHEPSTSSKDYEPSKTTSTPKPKPIRLHGHYGTFNPFLGYFRNLMTRRLLFNDSSVRSSPWAQLKGCDLVIAGSKKWGYPYTQSKSKTELLFLTKQDRDRGTPYIVH